MLRPVPSAPYQAAPAARGHTATLTRAADIRRRRLSAAPRRARAVRATAMSYLETLAFDVAALLFVAVIMPAARSPPPRRDATCRARYAHARPFVGRAGSRFGRDAHARSAALQLSGQRPARAPAQSVVLLRMEHKSARLAGAGLLGVSVLYVGGFEHWVTLHGDATAPRGVRRALVRRS